MGILLATITTLAMLTYNHIDGRVRELESWRAIQAAQQADIARQLGEVTARQQMVIQRLDANGAKLDDLLRVVYAMTRKQP
jgi:uncharacterized coiled-coil protein SlyX